MIVLVKNIQYNNTYIWKYIEEGLKEGLILLDKIITISQLWHIVARE